MDKSTYGIKAAEAVDEITSPYPPYLIDNRLYYVIDAQRHPRQMRNLVVQWPSLFESSIFNGNPTLYLQNLTGWTSDPAAPYEQTRLVSGLLLEEQLHNAPKPPRDKPDSYVDCVKAINTPYILAATATLCSVQDLFNETNPEKNATLSDDERQELLHEIQRQIANFWKQFPREDDAQPTIASTILDMHTYIVAHDLALFSNEPSDPAENITAKISAIKGLQIVERDIEHIMKQSRRKEISRSLHSFRNHVKYFSDLYAKEINFDLKSGRLVQPDTELGKTAVAAIITPPHIAAAA